MPKEYLGAVPTYQFNIEAGLIDAFVWEVGPNGERFVARAYTIPIHIAYQNREAMSLALKEFEAWEVKRRKSGTVVPMIERPDDH